MRLLTQAQYARARGLSRQAISQAVKDGRISLVGGKVDPSLADAIFALSMTGAGIPSFAESRAAREAFQAKLKRLEYERRRGALVPINEVDHFVSGMIITAREILSALPGELREMLAAETQSEKVEAMLRREINRALSQLSMYRPEGVPCPRADEPSRQHRRRKSNGRRTNKKRGGSK